MAGSPATIALEILQGTRARLTATFTALGSAVPGDPASVVFKIRTPAGVVTTLTYGVDAAVVKSATGVYYVDRTLDAKGIWWLQYKGSGASGIQATGEVAVRVDEAVIA